MAPLRRASGDPILSIETGAAYEFVMSLVTMSEVSNRDVLEVGPAWVEKIEQRAGPELMRRLAEFSQGTGDGFMHLSGLAYDTPAPREAESLIGHIEAADPSAVCLHLIGYYEYHVRRKTSGETMRAAAEGDQAAIAELIAATEDWHDWRRFLERVLTAGAERTKDDLLALLRAWNEHVWAEERGAIMPILERDAAAKREMATELPFERFVEQATNGVRYVARPQLDRLVLIPTYLNRPWVSYAEINGAMIMVYPVADESVAAVSDSPPLRLIRLTKALADEKRLRILRALAEEPRSLVGLAELFEMPKTSMHHHMITLRSAGLVSVTADKSEYRLRGDALPSLAQLLGGYISPAADRAPLPEPAASPEEPTPTGRPNRQRAPAVAKTR